jgi:hypothetical protein
MIKMSSPIFLFLSQQFLSNFTLLKSQMQLHIKELTTKQEMLAQFHVMQYLYTNFSLEKYDAYLSDMIPHNYKQIAVFENEVCVGLSGLWSGTKLWSDKYLEIDNLQLSFKRESNADKVLNKPMGCALQEITRYR